ncbi:MAG: phosphoenolpyruvate carboxykinase (GTP), partial [Lachnospiraceae bacterium]|nr:phosphoenolpyruvate carboxykinase (GTP) [Lachnospiraceae bacterium]
MVFMGHLGPIDKVFHDMRHITPAHDLVGIRLRHASKIDTLSFNPLYPFNALSLFLCHLSPQELPLLNMINMKPCRLRLITGYRIDPSYFTAETFFQPACHFRRGKAIPSVPISAILFGGRRPSTVPLVHQARSWNHGVFLGSIVGSEITAASTINADEVGKIRRDPFAIIPFCGYNMGDYFQHWINVGNAAK